MKYDVVLFDLDGTLTRSAPGIINCARYAAQEMGYPVADERVYEQFIGPPLHHSFTHLLGMTDAQADEAVRLYRVRFSSVGWMENAVYTGIPMLLRALKRQGVRVAMATAKPFEFATRILDYFGLSRFFDVQIGISPEEKHAEKAEIVHKALDALGFVPGERAVMVGDRMYDIEGARANGIDAIGAAYGYGTREELEQAGATHIAADVDALFTLLCGEDAQKRGIFLSVEGLDGSGKTTQLEMLRKYLDERGYDVCYTREPGGSPIGEKIRELLLDPANREMTALTEAYLYAAQRAQHVSEVIRPALKAGRLVLGDRYVYASAAFQGGGRQLGVERVMALNEAAVQGVMPDATLLFRVDTKVAMARRSAASALDRIEAEKEAFHQRVHDAYDALIGHEGARFVCVDASGTMEETQKNACAAVDAVLSRI